MAVAAVALLVAALADDGAPGWLTVVLALTAVVALVGDLWLLRRRLTSAEPAVTEPDADPSTQLPARQLFAREASTVMGTGDGTPAVLVIDIRGFRDVETVLGDPRAERVLEEVGRRISSVASSWPVGSLGGERFAVAMRTRPFLPAHHVGRNIREEIARPLDIGGVVLRLSSAVGIAQEEGATIESLLRRATIAAVAAQQDQEGVRLHQPEPQAVVRRRLAVATGLSEALEDPASRNLTLAFQPIVDAEGALTSAEALSRWDDPLLGHMAPDEFIPLAEHTGLIAPMFDHILREALTACAAWHRGGITAGVSINLSPLNLRDPLLMSKLQTNLERHGLRPRQLTVEITETSVISEPLIAARTLRELQRAGFRVAIDDFGVGQSSLSRLRDLPVDIVKLDKSFTGPLPHDRRSRAVVQASIAVCKALGLSVVAEGIERDDQADLLLEMGSDLLQGFLFSEALSLPDLMGGGGAQDPRSGSRSATGGPQ